MRFFVQLRTDAMAHEITYNGKTALLHIRLYGTRIVAERGAITHRGDTAIQALFRDSDKFLRLWRRGSDAKCPRHVQIEPLVNQTDINLHDVTVANHFFLRWNAVHHLIVERKTDR